MSAWLYLALAILAEVTATSFLKSTAGFTRPLPSAVVIVGYGAAFYFLAQTLLVIPVGVAYAIWAGLGVALIAVIGWVALGQRLDAPAFVGIALIIAGIVVLNGFSSATP